MNFRLGTTATSVSRAVIQGVEQALERWTHAFSPEPLLSTGGHVECLVPGRALRCVLAHRVFMNGPRTAVLR
jgi:formyltetrahydrofolate deformylase